MDIRKDSIRRSNEVAANDITAGKNFLAGKGTAFQMPSLVITKQKIKGASTWLFTQQITAHPEDPKVLMDLYAVGKGAAFNGVSYEEADRFTDRIVNVQFDLEGKSDFLVDGKQDTELVKEFLRKNNTLYWGKGSLLVWLPEKKDWAQKLLCLNGSVSNVLSDEAESYTLISAVPSQMRKWTATYCKTELVPKFEEAIKKLSAGTAENLLGRDVEIKDVVKYVAKFFLLMVPGIRGDFDLEKYGCDIFLGKFGGPEERCDGAAKVSDAVIADTLNVGKKQARGLFLQMRNFKTSKVAAVCESGTQLLEFEKLAAAEYGLVYVDTFEDITDDMYGKLVHVGVRNRVDFLSDLNGFKTVPKDSDKEDGLLILDMGKRGQGASNMQFLQYSQHVPGFTDTVVSLAKDSIKKKLAAMLSSRDYISGLDISLDKIYAPNLIAQVTPDVFTQSYLRNAVEKAVVQNLNNTIHRMHFGIDSVYLRGTAGAEFWLCKRQYLQEGEVYVNNNRLWGRDVCVCRNPRSAGVETYFAKVVSLLDLVDRIEADKNATGAEKEYYRIWYSSLSRNVLVTTGSADFKDKTGGSDFDFDGFAVIFDDRVRKLMAANPNFRVGILKDKKGAYTVRCDSIQELVTEGFIRTLTTGNRGVANVAVEDSKVQTVLNYRPKEGEPAVSAVHMHILANMGLPIPESDTVYTERYRKGAGNGVSEADVLGAASEILRSKYTPDAMNAYLRDVTIQYVSIIGRIIDSAKSGEAVTDPLEDGLKDVKQMFRSINPDTGKPFAYIAWDNAKKTFVPRVTEHSFRWERKTDSGQETVRYYLADPLYEAQKRIVIWACRLVNGLRKKAKPSETDKKRYAAASALSCLPCLKELDLASSDMNNVRQVSDIDSKALGKKAMAAADPYIADMARLYLELAGVAPEDRFTAALAVKDIDDAGSFAYNHLKAEAIRYAMTLPNAVTEIRERVLPVKDMAAPGTKTFTDGRCDDFVCTSFKFNGSFSVQRDGAEWFFRVQLGDIIKFPEPTGMMLLRVIHGSDAVTEKLNTLRATPGTVWTVRTFFPEKASPDSVWAKVPGGEAEKVCDVLLAKDPMTSFWNRTEIRVDDVIKGVLANKPGVKTTTILARLVGKEE